MFLLVGLGNYGEKYKNTRHNIGFMLVDKLREVYNIDDYQKKFSSDLYTGKMEKENIVLSKPLTYMNRSGIAVKEIKSFYKIPLTNILVVHDDLDLELGKIKVKVGGGNAGHNGLKSLDEHIGKNYIRIRVGIGRPKLENEDVSSFVLKKFPSEEQKIINKKIDSIVKNLPLLLELGLELGIEKFLNQLGLEAK